MYFVLFEGIYCWYVYVCDFCECVLREFFLFVVVVGFVDDCVLVDGLFDYVKIFCVVLVMMFWYWVWKLLVWIWLLNWSVCVFEKWMWSWFSVDLIVCGVSLMFVLNVVISLWLSVLNECFLLLIVRVVLWLRCWYRIVLMRL